MAVSGYAWLLCSVRGLARCQTARLADDNQQLRDNLAERDQDLAAARAANRELMTRLKARG
jgi:hypothetical protein